MLCQNQFDSMDLSDNAIIILDGFPKLARLKTLLLSNNRITRISRGLESMLAALRTLSHTLPCPVYSQQLIPYLLAAGQIPDLRLLNLANNRLRNLRVRSHPVVPAYIMMHAQLQAQGPPLATTAPLTLCRMHSISHGATLAVSLIEWWVQDLDPLATLPHLQNLCLLENEVCKLPNYR